MLRPAQNLNNHERLDRLEAVMSIHQGAIDALISELAQLRQENADLRAKIESLKTE